HRPARSSGPVRWARLARPRRGPAGRCVGTMNPVARIPACIDDGTAGAQPLWLPKAGELVAFQLRRRIVAGELTEGATLPNDPALRGELGVSRPTLREAWRVLESEGLISTRRGAREGPQVHPPTERVAARYATLVLQAERTTMIDICETREV